MAREDSPMSADSPDGSYAQDGSFEASPPLINGEKPRVRADGPGGSDVKPGARIACLECRSAKIRCSAPNDGKVPCKRCSRHDKECVFEKHRRGRKPGRPNLPKDKSAISAAGPSKPTQPPSHRQISNSPQQQSSAPYRPSAWSPANGGHPPSNLPHYPLPSPYARSPGGAAGHPSDYFSRPLPPPPPPPPAPSVTNGHKVSSSRSSNEYLGQQSGRLLHGRTYHPGSLPHFPSHDSGAAFYGPSRTLASPSPFEAQALAGGLSGYRTGPLSSSSSNRQQGFFSPPLSSAVSGRPSPSYPLASSSREESYARWGPTESSTRSRQSVESMPRRPSDPSAHIPPSPSSLASMGPPQPSFTRAPGNASKLSASRTLPAPHYQPQPPGTLRSSDEEDEEDELVDEDDVGGDHHDQDVLSRPLQLLAYASTAAARKQTHGGFRDPRSVAAAATLGLISSPRQLSQARRVAAGLKAQASPAASSISLPTSDAPLPPQKIASVGIQGGGGAEPSTLENGNWEYKAGRVRPIKTAENTASPLSTATKGSFEEAATAASEAAPIQQAIEFAPEAVSAIDSGIAADEGPHLGKRRRSDDEPLPVPPSRRASANVEGAEHTVAASNQLRRPSSRTAERMSIDETPAAVAEEDAPVDPVGASRKGYFRFSLYSSKLDVDPAYDPIAQGIASSKEMEDLFDLFFNKVNPSNFIFDPFLHSLTYIRARSKFLLTVIASISARMSEGCAELTERLECHWKDKLFPLIVTGGYKSVEISQAFLLASLFHRPTHIIVEDRAWQYLGMAIRTATEVGVNIALAPSPSFSAQDNEQLSRRVRNRQRLWKSLLIAEGTLSTQFGRPCTLSCTDSPLMQSVRWNREDFALPEDAALVCQIELRKLVEKHTQAFEACLAVPSGGNQVTDSISTLTRLRASACTDLETWKRLWCPTGGMDEAGVGGSMAMGAFLVRWSPYSRLIYNYWRCHLNSIVLQAAALRDEVATPIAHDSMRCARELIDTLLDDDQIGTDGLPLAPNAVVVMATYAAVSALRMTKLDVGRHTGVHVDAKATFDQVHKLAGCLEVAGRTPAHRDGAAAPYGMYLRSVLALFDTDSKSTSSVASMSDPAGSTTKDSKSGDNSQSGVKNANDGAASAPSSGSKALDEAFGNAAAAAAAVAALSNGGSGSGRGLTPFPIPGATKSTSTVPPPPPPIITTGATAAGGPSSSSSSASPFPSATNLYPNPAVDGDSEEVWEYLTGGGSASAAAAAALWPSTPSTAWGGGSV